MTRRRLILVAVLLLAVLGAILAVVRWRATSSPAQATAADPGARQPSPSPPRGDVPPPAPVELAGPITLSAATVVPAPEAAAGELAGRVLDWGTGAPVPGAEVAIAGADGGGTSSFVTGADGSFVVRPPVAGRYRVVSALAAGYLPWAPDPDASPLELVARPGVRVEGVALYLIPAVTYHGLVVDPGGAPVVGATVVLLGASAGEREAAPIADTFTTGADGRFDFHSPDNALLEARAAGFAPGRARLGAAAQVSHELTITLGAAGGTAPVDLTITGRVVDAAGAAVGGARVEAGPVRRGRDDELLREAAAIADADGRFELTGLDASAYAVNASARGHASNGAMASAGDRDVVVQLGQAARIVGRVVDPSGAPVPAATVAVLQRPGLYARVVAVASVFDAEGRFVIDDLPPDDYLVTAQAAGFAPSTEVAATASADPAAEVVVAVRRGAILVGTLIDGDSKAPLEGGKVTVEGSFGEGSTAVPLVTTAITGADGSFELAGIAPGRRSVTAGAYAHHMVIVGPLDVADGARIGPMTIELTATLPGETPRIELAGIGAALAADGDSLRVDRVIEGGGAERAGIVAGDRVLAVDGVPVGDLGLDGAIQLIRGPVGTKVVLKLRRADAAEQDISVTRTKIRA